MPSVIDASSDNGKDIASIKTVDGSEITDVTLIDDVSTEVVLAEGLLLESEGCVLLRAEGDTLAE